MQQQAANVTAIPANGAGGIPTDILDMSNEAIALIVKKARFQRDLEGRFEFTLDVDKITALYILECVDEKQRRIAKTRMTQIRRDIDNGRWENTGAPIMLSMEGTLIDGQHRLTAFVNCSDDNFVLRDMTIIILKNRSGLDVVDTGKSRTVNDIRKMTGREYLPTRAIGGILFEFRDFDQKADLSKIERNEVVDTCLFLPEINSLASNHASTPVVAAAIRCMQKDKDQSYKFFLAAVTNEHHLDGKYITALKVLSTWLLNNKHSGGGHAIRRETVVRSIHAWNAYRAGRDVKYLRYVKLAGIPKAR